MPTYNNTTPGAADIISATQNPIQTNFASIETAFEVNHIDLSGAVPGSNCGKHKYIQFPEQGAAPTTAVNEGALYTAVGAISNKTELCFRREDSGGAGGAVIPMSEYENSGTTGWCYLPSGLLMKWKDADSAAGGDETVTVNWGPNFAGLVPVTVFVTTKWSSVTKDSYARLNEVTTAAQPVVTVRCTKTSDPTQNAKTYFRILVIGI